MCYGIGSMSYVVALRISSVTSDGDGTRLEGLADVSKEMHEGNYLHLAVPVDIWLGSRMIYYEISCELGVTSHRQSHYSIVEP